MTINILPFNKELIYNQIFYLAKSIETGKYIENNLIILPFISEEIDTIYFPNLGYSKEFWKTVKKTKHQSIINSPPRQAKEELAQQLEHYISPSQERHENFYKNTEKSFLQTLQKVIEPKIIEKIETIEIYFSEFGTLGSFDYIDQKNGKKKISCIVRTSSPLENIFEILVQSILLTTQTQYSDIGSIGGHERNGVMKFLRDSSPLGNYLNQSKQSHSYNSKYLIESSNFLAILGFPSKTNLFTQKLKLTLTPQEETTLQLLIDNKNIAVSFDDIGKVLWGDQIEEKFSLYAITKVIENIRRKVKQSGINKEVITTIRKQGYVLSI